MKFRFLWREERNSFEADHTYSYIGEALVMVYTGVSFGPWFLGFVTALKLEVA